VLGRQRRARARQPEAGARRRRAVGRGGGSAEQLLQPLDALEELVVAQGVRQFYVYPDVRGLLGRSWRGTQVNTTLELADLILDEAQVAVVPRHRDARDLRQLGDDELATAVEGQAHLLGLGLRTGERGQRRVAKTYAMTGWRVGWMVGPADAIKVAGNLQSHLSSNVNNIVWPASSGTASTIETARAPS
jgi:hypothetical protein